MGSTVMSATSPRRTGSGSAGGAFASGRPVTSEPWPPSVDGVVPAVPPVAAWSPAPSGTVAPVSVPPVVPAPSDDPVVAVALGTSGTSSSSSTLARRVPAWSE